MVAGRRKRVRAEGFYADKFTEQERQLLAGAADGELVDEAQLLRVLIRRLIETPLTGEPDPEAIGRLVDRLGRLVRARRAAAGREDGHLEAELMARLGDKALTRGREAHRPGGEA